ncbi:MAG: ATP phosphoribosyltransferase [Eubacteriales bacterium]|nr:ATP phosphoribosyltransferase [Eubacteriales bacterium]
MTRYINIALAKGRLAELSAGLFRDIGIFCGDVDDDSRKLIISDEENKVRLFLVKPGDVPVYVEYGAADIGIAGRDTLLEEGRNVYEVLDLGFGACRMVLAGPGAIKDSFSLMSNKRVATKYPRIAREYFDHKMKESVEIIKLSGSVELAPLTGLSDVIVDIVESGKTLKENGLEVFETIASISARMIVNRVSMKMESDRINKIIADIRQMLAERNKTAG